MLKKTFFTQNQNLKCKNFDSLLQKYSSTNLYFDRNRFKIKFRYRIIKKNSEIKKKNFCKNWAKGVHH